MDSEGILKYSALISCLDVKNLDKMENHVAVTLPYDLHGRLRLQK